MVALATIKTETREQVPSRQARLARKLGSREQELACYGLKCDGVQGDFN